MIFYDKFISFHFNKLKMLLKIGGHLKIHKMMCNELKEIQLNYSSN